MIKLTPRIYKSNIQMSLLATNKIDTVNLHPISNVASDTKIFHSEAVKNVKIGGNEHTLPLGADVTSTHFRTVNNAGRGNIFAGSEEYAKSRVDCVMVSGTTRITAQEVVPGTPIASIRLLGRSYTIDRGGSTYGSYPSSSDMSSLYWSSAEWIKNNKTETKDYLTWDYSQATFSFNPWIRRVVPADISGTHFVTPSSNDIITDWVLKDVGGSRANVDYWTENSNFNISTSPQFTMFSQYANSMGGDEVTPFTTQLRMRNVHMPLKVNIERIDDYNFDVSWSVPVRFAYIAAAQYFGVLTKQYDVDNFAFVDEVSEIVIELTGAPYSSDVVDLQYGLSDSGKLTEEVTDLFPFDIDAGEAMTLSSFKGYNTYQMFHEPDARRGKAFDAEGTVDDENSFISNYIWGPVGSVIIAPAYSGEVKGVIYNTDYGREDVIRATPDTSGLIYIYCEKECYIRLNGDINVLDAGNYYINVKYPISWIDTLSKQLLTKYKTGVYTVVCTVPAKWAVENAISVNTQMQIQLLNGDMIKRKNKVCTFEIKNISKRYSNREFVYEIKLMEV